eukprot:PhM_4_TR14691/c3_g4_i3/m.68283
MGGDPRTNRNTNEAVPPRTPKHTLTLRCFDARLRQAVSRNPRMAPVMRHVGPRLGPAAPDPAIVCCSSRALFLGRLRQALPWHKACRRNPPCALFFFVYLFFSRPTGDCEVELQSRCHPANFFVYFFL